MDLVLLGELLGEGNAQLIEVAESILYDLRAGCVAEEEGGFGVLDWLWGFFVEGTFAARIARFAGISLAFEGRHIPRNITFVATCWVTGTIVKLWLWWIDSSNFSVEKNNHNR